MEKIFNYFTGVYKKGDPYYYRKARHTLAFLTMISIYVVMGLVSDVLPSNLSAQKFIIDLIVLMAFIGIAFIIKKGYLKLAVNLLMFAGILYLLDYFTYDRSLLFYIQAFLALLVGTAVHTARWQLHFAYTFILSLATYRHFYIWNHVTIPSVEKPYYIEQSSYALMGLYVFFFIILFFHYIIENEILENQKVSAQMRLDSLTGLKNRMAFDDYVSQIQDFEAYTICYLDLDFFKRINDLHGHQIGDETLISFAESLEGYFEPEYPVFRWGGEEFMVVLKGKSLEEALALFEAYKRLTRKIPIFERYNLTYSGGIVNARRGETYDDVMQKCDELLYLAKSRGRNQIAYA